MSALPAAAAVTVPSLTEATVSSEEDHVTVWSAAFSGTTEAVSTAVSPANRESAVLSSVTPVTDTGFSTVRAQEAFTLPQAAVMVAAPSFRAVILPSVTVATVSSEEVHTTVSVVFSGCTEAVSTAVSPVCRVRVL